MKTNSGVATKKDSLLFRIQYTVISTEMDMIPQAIDKIKLDIILT